MGGVDGCCGAASGEREGDREREEAPSGALFRVSIECLGRGDANDGGMVRLKQKTKY